MSPRSGIGLQGVVDCAGRIADRDGIEAVTLAAVAADLGIQPPSLYNYVNGLPGMKRELTLRGLNDLGAQITDATVGLSGDEAVRDMAFAIRGFALSHPGLYAATIHATVEDDPELTAAGDRVGSVILAVLRAYRLEENEAVHAMRCLRTAIHGFAAVESVNGFRSAADIDGTFERLIRLLIDGLDSWPRSAKTADREPAAS